MTNAIEKPITSVSRTPSRKLLPYLLAVFITLLGFTAVSAGVVALVRNATPPSDPFASFADVFPGQPRSAVEARGFSCLTFSSFDYESTSDSTCVLLRETGAFSLVSVVVDQRIVRQIAFWTRENALRVGDMMALWGQPEVQLHSRSVYLYWRHHSVFAIASHDTGRFSLFLPVRRVYFAATMSTF